MVGAAIFPNGGRLHFELQTWAARKEALVPLLDLLITFPTEPNRSPEEEHYFPWPLDAAHTALLSGLTSFWFCFVLFCFFLGLAVKKFFPCVSGCVYVLLGRWILEPSCFTCQVSLKFSPCCINYIHSECQIIIHSLSIWKHIQLQCCDGPLRAKGKGRNQVSEWGTYWFFSLKLSKKFYTELSTPCNFLFPDRFYAAGVACQCHLSGDRHPGEGASSSHLCVGPGNTPWGQEGLRALFCF